MSDYTKTTNFTAKDSLPSGNSGKIVKGSEIDTEFDNIQTAVATKLNTNNGALTGTTTFQTLSDGTIAITAFVDEDNMSSNSATLIPTQQSVKAYVDATVTAEDLDITTDSGSIAIDLDSETLTISGGEGIDTSATGSTLTIAAEEATTSNKGVASFSSDDFSVSSGAVSLATTATAAELNILDGVTSTTAELNILDGVTSTTAELNILDGVTSTTAELNILDGVTSTSAELNILDGVTSTATELNILDGVTATAAELNYSDTGASVGTVVASKVVTVDANKDVASFRNITLTGELDAGSLDISGNADIDGTLETDALSINGTSVTSTAAELNILDGVTSTAAELNLLDGVTSTTAELNILDGVTSTAAELNILDGVTSTAAELNILDGVTSTTAELNILDGVTATTTELNYVDGVTSAIQTQLDAKAALAGANFTGNVDVAGTLTTDAFSIEDATSPTLTLNDTTSANQKTTLSHTAGASVLTTGDNGVFGSFKIAAFDGSSTINRLLIADNGDVSLYEDGGSTAKLVWDSSAEALEFADNAKATFGAGNDLQIYHDASNSYLEDAGTGNLILKTGAGAIQLLGGSDVMLNAAKDGAVTLYHDNAAKIATTATGIDVTGITNSDGMSTSTSGTSNFIAGVNAGNSIASGGNYNVVVGDEAGTALTTGDNNVAIGFEALSTEDANGNNVAVGYRALKTLNAGADSYNVAMGYSAGAAVTTGIRNTLLGGVAGLALTDADFNVAIGMNALSTDTLGSKSTAVGTDALQTQNFTSDTDSNNTAVGYNAGNAVTTGIQNTLIGANAGDALTDADGNIAVGINALSSDRLGSHSVAVGNGALFAQNFGTATNAFNVGIGYAAGGAITTGINNTLVGAASGDAITTGSSNTFVGYALNRSAADVNNELLFGSSITGGGTNTVRLGTSGGNATLNLDGSDTSWAAASDERLKKDVADSTVGLSFINALRPVTFKWNAKNAIADTLPQYDADSSDPVYGVGKAHHGFIAQEVKAVIDANSDVVNGHGLWLEDPDGTQQVAPSALVPMLVKAIQDQDAIITALTARVAALES